MNYSNNLFSAEARAPCQLKHGNIFFFVAIEEKAIFASCSWMRPAYLTAFKKACLL